MLNRVSIMGRLVRDPELRRTQSGIAVTTVRIAVDRDFKGPDGSKQADFFDVVAWRNTAEFVSRYFTKGSMIIVDGSLQTREWTDRDGNKRVNVEIVADRTYFGSSRRDNNGEYGAPTGGYGAPSGGYSAPAGGYGAAPGYGAPSGGYGAAPGYGAPSGGYGAPAGGYGYGAPSGGYGGYEPAPAEPPAPSGSTEAPATSDSPASSFAEMSEDDGDLPF